MSAHLKIDFVSDISCPWCVTGLNSPEQALERIGHEATAEIHFQPFELNPHEVRAREQHYRQQGIHAVPSVIVNGKYLIQGGQPAEVLEQALRKIAAESRQSA